MSYGAELVWTLSRKLKILTGRRVQRVEGAGNSVVISFNKDEGGLRNPSLVISWDAQNAGLVILPPDDAKKYIASRSSVPAVANAIKSHITGAELKSIAQLQHDRILRFEFEKIIGAGFVSRRFVTAEIMDRFSNLLITDENNIIIETAKHIYPADNPYRTILPSSAYRLPPEFAGIPLDVWLARPEKETIMSIAGFGKPLLRELSAYDIDAVCNILKNFYAETDSTADFICQKIGRYITYLPVLLPEAERMPDILFCANTSSSVSTQSAFEKRKKNVINAIKKEITRRERQIADIEQLLSDKRAADYKTYGDMITANIWKLKRGTERAELSGYDGCGREICVSVPMDAKLTPSQNAENYFAKYKKITAAQERASLLLGTVAGELNDNKEALELAASVVDAESLSMLEDELGIENMQCRGRKQKKTPVLPPHRRFEFEHAIVFAGMSAKGNRYVTFKAARPEDLWFHVQGVPGSHVILRFTDDADAETLENLKRFCASLAVFHSKADASSKQRVDYTKRKYVSPIKGGIANVTYKEFSTIAEDGGLWREFTAD